MRKKHIGALAWLLAMLLTLSACGGGGLPPDDPLYPSQTNLAELHIESAWSVGMTGKGVKIALIDTGVAEHPDLNSRRITGKSYVDEDESDLTDKVGHGTFIAGLLAASRGNGKGIAGMTDSDLVVLKVWSTSGQASVTTLAQAIRDAVDVYGCGVINLSMGTPNDSAQLREAVDYAAQQGAILVASAGGDSETPVYPAAYDAVVGVDALNAAGELPETAARNGSVFVTAPGEELVSLGVNGGYVHGGAGASYAAAQVTALAAIAKQYQPYLTCEGFMELLKTTAVDKGAAGYDTDYGWGAVDAAPLVEILSSQG